MPVSYWSSLKLPDSILTEPIPDPNRLVFWQAMENQKEFRLWERISTLPTTSIILGVTTVPATSIQARQQKQGILHRWLSWRRNESRGQIWILPNGETAEQYSERQTDLLLAWSEDEATPLADSRLRAIWPQARRIQQLGENLFLVAGVTISQSSPNNPEPSLPLAELQVEAARTSLDPGKLAAALTDLGALCLRRKEVERAVTVLKEAVAVAH